MFSTMASIAAGVVQENGLDDIITVVNAKSAEVEEGSFDMIVSELLDSSLLGESCMPSHADGIARLMNHSVE